MERRPRIGVLSTRNARNPGVWSGIPFHMALALQKYCGDVVFLGPAHGVCELAARMRSRLARALGMPQFRFQHCPLVARSYARIFARRIRRACRLDFLFCPAGSEAIAYLETDIPIVYTSDATFCLMNGYYERFSGLPRDAIDAANDIERRAIRKATVLAYPSQWSAESAVRDYGAPAARVHVIEYGANLADVDAPADIHRRKAREECRVLFLGIDWRRKGGDIAFDAVAELRHRGIPATLTVCGCQPPADRSASWMRIIPWLNKSDPDDARRLSELLLEAHYLLLPSRQECFGIVYCEASSRGALSIGTRTGGTPNAVLHGRSGFLLDSAAPATAYADILEATWTDRHAYRAFSHSAREVFEERLNWSVWARRINALLARAN